MFHKPYLFPNLFKRATLIHARDTCERKIRRNGNVPRLRSREASGEKSGTGHQSDIKQTAAMKTFVKPVGSSIASSIRGFAS
jgi:hypothetical protein